MFNDVVARVSWRQPALTPDLRDFFGTVGVGVAGYFCRHSFNLLEIVLSEPVNGRRIES